MIDDPISSLDSNILFIVSTIIKNIINDVKDGSHIKQLLLFTHNVYFHKEASFQGGRSNGCNKTNYWILRKKNNITNIQAYGQNNPIESSYELLWKEISEPEKLSLTTIQNTMRRILENYFKILGRYSDNDIIEKFTNNEEKQMCKSLLYWIKRWFALHSR
ncbi:AAA family ATPase [Photobacterium damselae subsp. piscicida]|nr:AAA family ATPase [Photobacterium damselae subsp. piscicida]